MQIHPWNPAPVSFNLKTVANDRLELFAHKECWACKQIKFYSNTEKRNLKIDLRMFILI